MTHATELDLGPLTWVKGEIDASLGRAAEALEEAASAADAAARVQFAQTHLHQASGALSIVGLDGLSQFASALEQLLGLCARGERAIDADVLALGRRALAAIGNYLEELTHGAPDQPLRLSALYAEIGAARGIEETQPVELFFPDLSRRPPRQADTLQAGGDPARTLRTGRLEFQRGLLNCLRTPGDGTGPQMMREALAALDALHGSTALRAPWWAGTAMLDGVIGGDLSFNRSLAQLCSRLDMQIRRVLAGSTTVPDRLMRELLYVVAGLPARTATQQAVRRTWQLDALMPEAGAKVSEAPLAPLLKRLHGTFAIARDHWDGFCQGTAAALPAFESGLLELAGDAAQLGRPALDRLLAGLIDFAQWLRKDPLRFSDPVSLEVATALLLAEAALDRSVPDAAFGAQVNDAVSRLAALMRGETLQPVEASPSIEAARRAQEREAVAQLAREVLSNLAQVEQALDDFFRNHEKRAPLAALATPLKQIEGALALLGDEAAIALVRDAARTVAGYAAGDAEPDAGECEELASRLSALGFYVEALQRGPADLDRFLHPERSAATQAEDAVAAIVPETEQSPAAAAPVEEPAPAEPDATMAETGDAAEEHADVADALGSSFGMELEEDVKPAPAPVPAPAPETLKLIQASSEEVDAELLAIFIEEAQEVIGTMREHIAREAAEPSDIEHLTSIRRGFHTLKGSGRMVGLRELGEVAWGIEQTLNRWLQLELQPSAELRQLITDAHALFADWVSRLAAGDGSAPDYATLLADAERLRTGEEPAEAAAPPPPAPAADAPAEQITDLAETAFDLTEFELPEFEFEQPVQAPANAFDAAEFAFAETALEPLLDLGAAESPEAEADLPAEQPAPAAPPIAELQEFILLDEPEAEQPAVAEATEAPPAALPPAALPPVDFGAETLVAEPFMLFDSEAPELPDDVLPEEIALEPLADDLRLDEAAADTSPVAEEPVAEEPLSAPDAAALEKDESLAESPFAEPLADADAFGFEFDIEAVEDILPEEALRTEDAEPGEALPEDGVLAAALLTDELPEDELPEEALLARALADEEAADEVAAEAEPTEVEPTDTALHDAALADEAQAEAEPVPVREERAEAESEAPPAPAQQDLVRIGDAEISRPLFDLYLAEAQHHIGTLHQEFARLRDNPFLVPQESAHRAAHTLAGISGTARIMPLHALGRALEHALERLHLNEISPPVAHIDLLASTCTTIEAMLAEAAQLRMPLDMPELIEQLDAVGRPPSIDEQEAAPATAAPAAESRPAPAPAPTAAAEVEDEAPTQVHDDIDEQLLPIFLEEGADLVSQAGSVLRQWRGDNANADHAKGIARLLHTLKGSARMAGAMRLGEHIHHLESRLESALRTGRDPAALIDELESGLDLAEQTIEAFARGETAPAMSEAGPPAGAEAPQPTAAGPAPQEAPAGESESGSGSTLRVRADAVDRFVNEAGEIGIARTRIEGELRTLRRSLLDLTENVIRLRNQLREAEIQAEVQMQSRIAQAESHHAEFDPLEMDRYTRLQELTRMMAESVGDVTTVQQSLLRNLDAADLALHSQARLSRDLQQALMRVRMLPFDSLADRLYRVVRQSAKDLGKRANLDLRGGRIEVDRSVLEHMTAPLEHLLRNAVAHGLETPEQRRAAGKNEIGQITLTVRQEGSEIAIELADDGKGLDFARIAQRARENGLLGVDEAADERRLTNLIFVPGFSTAGAVSAVSGRGVGMDVVKAETAAVGGRIDVHSTPGEGAAFRIYLPLTLAVTQALLVAAGNRTYAIPSSMIAQVMEIKTGPLDKVREDGGIEWQGEHFAYRYLPRLLGDEYTQPEVQRFNWLLLLRAGAQTLALHVDALRGNQEIVVKSAGPQIARLVGVSGATVLGNGEIVLILNPVALASRSLGEDAPAGADTMRPAPAEPVQRVPTILVVDDSLTVRKITGRLLEREGYRVVTAKDGVDALETLLDTVPDVILSDIEMPRMDGFDLVRNVRADERTKAIPVIMITSRLAEKHRRYAEEIGANHYLGKPFQEEELLGLLAAYTGRSELAGIA